MKKCIIAFFVFALTGFFLTWRIPASLMTTLFTVAGVMFSVGMSLVVTMSTQNIHQPQAKKMAQDTINNLLRNYIVCFIITTVCFAFAMMFKVDNEDAFKPLSITLFNRDIDFNYPLSLLLYTVYSICYYIYNMWATRKQHFSIERQIEEEMKDE